MPAYQIGWLLNVHPQVWKETCSWHKKALEADPNKIDGNVWAAIKLGRSDGDSTLLKTAYQLAVGVHERDAATGKVKTVVPPNEKILIHLLKTRLKHAETVNVNHKGDGHGVQITFQTQIGKDGVIRTSEQVTGDDDQPDAGGSDVWN